MRIVPLTVLSLFGCAQQADDYRPLPDGPGSDTEVFTSDTEDTEVETALEGFIGSPCASDDDCPYDGGLCLTEEDGFPGGMCSAPCDLYCDDLDGYPTTFCLDAAEAEPVVRELGDGACHSRCDFEAYPDGGCRQDYGCAVGGRANDDAETYVCMPDTPSELTDCHLELVDRGIPFEPTVHTPTSPADHPELTCTIEDPVYILGEIDGVGLYYQDGTPTPRVLGSCEMAHALADTVEMAKDDGLVRLYHYGTYNCRVISGTDELSRHGYGDAIDLTAFEFADGTVYDVEDDWEHDTTSFRTDAAAWLYEESVGWYDAYVWNIVLTPNYNSAHDNHFHVDLTPGSHYRGLLPNRYYGPAPFSD